MLEMEKDDNLRERYERDKEDRIEKAINNMQYLNILPEAIKDFEENGKIYVSENGLGILYNMSADLEKKVKEMEEKYNLTIYHIIKDFFEFGTCYSMLLVSNYKEEWDMDKRQLEQGTPLVYVYNETVPNWSEFGHIAIKSMNGGLVRLE